MNIVGFLRAAGTLGPQAEAPAAPAAPQAGEATGFAALLAGLLAEAAPPEPPPAPSLSLESGAESQETEGEEAAAPQEEAEPAAGESAGTGRDAELPTDVNRIHRGLEGLNPDFRQRLTRVIDRMQREHGHSVTVNETLRTQGRQEHLYAQGRTRPGPVVTWTLNSNHRSGNAADLVIDGTYDNPAGYARLARIAEEEGLRTLGAKDPGHVELPRQPGTAGAGERFAAAAAAPGLEMRSAERLAAAPSAVRAPEMARATGVAEVARVADVAQVARVAQVAEVARVAPVAAAGSAPTAEAVRGAEAARVAPAPASPVTIEGMRVEGSPGGGQPGQAEPRSGGGGDLPRRHREEDARPKDGERSEVRDGALAFGSRAGPGRGESIAPVREAAGVDMAARIARAMEAQQGTGPQTVSSILLRMDNPLGGEDRIRVDLRGTAVGTHIDLSDPGTADRANARVDDLRQAFQRQGLEAESVQIRTTGARAEAVETARAAIHAAEESRPGSSARGGGDSSPRGRSGEGSPQDGSRSQRDSQQQEQQQRHRNQQRKELA